MESSPTKSATLSIMQKNNYPIKGIENYEANQKTIVSINNPTEPKFSKKINSSTNHDMILINSEQKQKGLVCKEDWSKFEKIVHDAKPKMADDLNDLLKQHKKLLKSIQLNGKLADNSQSYDELTKISVKINALIEDQLKLNMKNGTFFEESESKDLEDIETYFRNNEYDEYRIAMNDLLLSKCSQIKDLVKLVDEQKQLRHQDANLVEEKAAKIKEWVASKLKELENQNKSLRDQNKKQKETIDKLNEQIKDLKHDISVLNTDRLQAKLLQSSDTLTLSNNSQSLYHQDSRTFHTDLIDSCNNKLVNNKFRLIRQNSEMRAPQKPISQSHYQPISYTNSFINQEIQSSQARALLSPRRIPLIKVDPKLDGQIYDSVTMEHLVGGKQAIRQLSNVNDQNQNHIINRQKPPPLPLHQSEKYELRLYQMADKSVSSSLTDDCNSPSEDSDKSLSTRDSPSILNSLTLSSLSPTLNLTSNNNNDSSTIFTSTKLYDFMSNDLYKRGSLIKPGALKNHVRWVVLSKSSLELYKSDLDEKRKEQPLFKLELSQNLQILLPNNHDDNNNNSKECNNFPFKISGPEKCLNLIADSAFNRDEWIRILSLAIRLSDVSSSSFELDKATYQSQVSFTRHAYSKICHAILFNRMLFFVKSMQDPTPISYIYLREAKICEITYTYSSDDDDSCFIKSSDNGTGSCDFSKNKTTFIIAIYPRYSSNTSNSSSIYIMLNDQTMLDLWLYYLSLASGIDQTFNTKFECSLSLMSLTKSIENSANHGLAMPYAMPFMDANKLFSFYYDQSIGRDDANDKISTNHCKYIYSYRDHSILTYTDKPLDEPLTSLPNETIRSAALELSKSVMLYTQTPVAPIAVDYHICLLQTSFQKFMDCPELRNEFYSQLLKQLSIVNHKCCNNLLQTNNSDASDQQRCNNTTCKLVCDLNELVVSSRDSSQQQLHQRSSSFMNSDSSSSLSSSSTSQTNNYLANNSPTIRRSSLKSNNNSGSRNSIACQSYASFEQPTSAELLQTLQVLSLLVSLDLPKGRIYSWLLETLNRFITNSNSESDKYAKYTLKATERTMQNGSREFVPSRREILSIIMRNPYDHSKPHSLPLNFADKSYVLVEADGSTTVDEFMVTLRKQVDIRQSSESDFYIYTDDPNEQSVLHLIGDKVKILDRVAWWESSFKSCKFGKYETSKAVRLVCEKRLVFSKQDNETDKERQLIVQQLHNDIVLEKIRVSYELAIELCALMSQFNLGNMSKIPASSLHSTICSVCLKYLPSQYHESIQTIDTAYDDNNQNDNDENNQRQLDTYSNNNKEHESHHSLTNHIIKVKKAWHSLNNREPLDCVRVYLNCVRKLGTCQGKN